MKYVSILGDSISTFEGCNTKGYSIYYDEYHKEINGIKGVEDMWWHKVITHLGAQLCTNNSYSGSLVTGDKFPAANTYQRINSLCTAFNKPDIILVNIGFNDFGYGRKIYPDYNNDHDFLSFIFAYGIMLDRIREVYPDSQIICGTLVRGYVKDHKDRIFPDAPVSYHIDDYNNVIRDSCKKRNIRLADIAQSGEFLETLELCHPTAAGQDTLAKLWIKYIDTN